MSGTITDGDVLPCFAVVLVVLVLEQVVVVVVVAW